MSYEAGKKMLETRLPPLTDEDVADEYRLLAREKLLDMQLRRRIAVRERLAAKRAIEHLRNTA